MKSIFLVILLFAGVGFLKADDTESKLEALSKNLVSSPNDSNKVHTLIKLANVSKSVSISEADSYANRALHLSVGLNFRPGVVKSLISIAEIKSYQFDVEGAIHQLVKAKKLAKSDAPELLYLVELKLGEILLSHDRYDQAFEEYFTAYQRLVELEDTLPIIESLLGLGDIYLKQENYSKAFEHYVNARNLAIQRNLFSSIAWGNAKIGKTYILKDQAQKAIELLNKSLQEFIDLGDEKGVAWCNVVLGDLSLRNDNQTEALAYYYKAISIYENNNLNHDKAEMNLKISKCYIDLKDYNNAIKYTQESISLAQELNSNYLLQEAYLIMSICYEKLDKYEKAHDFFKKYSYLKDSVLDREREKNIAELQTKYESEKKDRQNRILSQQMDMKEIEKRQLENEIGKDKIIKTILIVGGLLLLAISFFLFKNMRSKQKTNQLLAQSNVEIIEQKSIIEEKNREIVSSMSYARKIQNAVLPNERILTQCIKDYFIFFQPKELVSGDFYWFYERDNELLFTAADCTGHGIPGGFMSMISTALLNDVVRDMGVMEPKLILSELRKKIIQTLHTTAETENKDGIDMGLCSINKETYVLKYSGANNPAYIIRKGNRKLKTTDGQEVEPNTSLNDVHLYFIKADKQPVGFLMGNLTPFIQHNFQLEKDDLVILFSDGFADQFGGSKGKKMLAARFKEMLIMLYEYETAHIEERLSFMFNEWKGKHEQLDDVCVFGIKI